MANFIAFAPDGLTSLGGYPGDEEKAAALFRQLDRAKLMEDLLASAAWLKSRPDCAGKLGAIGFCYGGGVVNQLAVKLGSDLAAAVPFYGAQPSAEDTAKINSADQCAMRRARYPYHRRMGRVRRRAHRSQGSP